ncbi:DUF3540 domain-containing protein [Chondromyces apiculatus]|nr:DUF3540 domain-containing protein [Chondromyces apiculatus]
MSAAIALSPAPTPTLTPAPEHELATLADGERVVLREGGVEISDRAGRLLVRYVNGSAEIAAPAGDLILAAPGGRVVVRAETEVEVEAPKLKVRAEDAEVTTGEVTVVARRIATTAQAVVQQVERFELTATKIVERARDTFRDVTDLAQTRAGRARTIVEDVCSIYARRTALVSREDTSIDGRRVLLG